MPTPADLRTRFPETFGNATTFPDTRLQAAITAADNAIRSDLGTQREEAFTMLSAHNALVGTPAAGGGGAGPGGAQSITVGPVSVSYGSMTSPGAGGSTSFYQEFLRIISSVAKVRFPARKIVRE